MIIAVDTETSGLFNFRKPSSAQVMPRMLSLAAVAFQDDGNEEVGSFYTLIRPDGFTIDNNSEACKVNGITQELAMECGVKLGTAMSMLDGFAYSAKYIVFFNASFDTAIIANEIDELRKIKPDRKNWLEQKKIRCMKVAYTSLCKLPPNPGYSDYAWPSLDQAYEWAFGKPRGEGAHNSLADSRDAGHLAFGAVDNGWWSFEPPQTKDR